MHTRYAGSVATAVSIVAAIAMHAMAARLVGLRFGRPYVIVAVFWICLFGVLGWGGVASWRYLSRLAKAGQDSRAYELGVRGFGIKFYFGFSVGFILFMYALALGNPADPSMFVAAVVATFAVPVFAFPVSIWTGYICGQVASRTFPSRK
jgi:hypothetical protein